MKQLADHEDDVDNYGVVVANDASIILIIGAGVCVFPSSRPVLAQVS